MDGHPRRLQVVWQVLVEVGEGGWIRGEALVGGAVDISDPSAAELLEVDDEESRDVIGPAAERPRPEAGRPGGNGEGGEVGRGGGGGRRPRAYQNRKPVVRLFGSAVQNGVMAIAAPRRS